MMISTKGRYALRVMIELATRGEEEYIPLRDIAQRQEISEKYLEAILKILVRENMVVGLRGKGGGYQLSKKPSEYTVGSILKRTEGSLAPVACLGCGEDGCPRADQCATLPMWRELDALIDGFLEGITLEQLAEQALPAEERKNAEK